MADLRARFATLDRAPVPDLWSRIEARAVDLGSIRLDRPVTRRDQVRPRGLDGRRSTFRLPIAAVLAVLLAAGALAIGSGVIKLPMVLQASPSPSADAPAPVSPSPTVAPPGPVWMSGQELMDRLSTAYAETWVSTFVGGGTTVFTAGDLQVQPPFDGPARVSISVDLYGSLDTARLHAARVAGALAPDVVAWLDGAVTKAFDAAGATAMSTRSESGGQVLVSRVDERDLADWLSVAFLPEPLPLRGPVTAGSGAIAYLDSGAVWVVNPDGTEPGRVLVSSTTAYGVRALLGWSADGMQLFYETDDGSGWVTDPGWESATRLGGASRSRLCPKVVAADNCQANLEEAAISPDGHRVAYPLLEGADLDISSIAVFDLTTSIVTRLDATSANGRGACAAGSGSNGWVDWSPDGERVTFERQGMGPKCEIAIFVVNADGRDLRRLTTPDMPAFRPRWSPDGSHIAFSSVRGDIYTVRPDGSELLRLTTGAGSGWPYWTRDGRIVFVRTTSPDAGTGELWIVGADGGAATQLDLSVPALTAAGCITCPYPGAQGAVIENGAPKLAFWQPIPAGVP